MGRGPGRSGRGGRLPELIQVKQGGGVIGFSDSTGTLLQEVRTDQSGAPPSSPVNADGVRELTGHWEGGTLIGEWKGWTQRRRPARPRRDQDGVPEEYVTHLHVLGYWLRGQLVSGMTDAQLARVRNREIGFVFQTFNLLARASALRNVELPLMYGGVPGPERRRRAEEVLAGVGLTSRRHHRPNELSGGQRQRVAIARALVNRPALILADEPTGNLDSRTGADVMNLFADLHRNGQTLVVVTHDADIASHAMRRVVFHDGRIVADEPTERGRELERAGGESEPERRRAAP